MMGWIGGSVVFKFLFSRLGGVGAGGGWLGDGGGPGRPKIKENDVNQVTLRRGTEATAIRGLRNSYCDDER